MEDEKSHWHWEQGTKYAVEGIKTTLLLNGAAAIALMTFATTNEFSFLLPLPLLSFVGGAALSAFAFFAAYKTQLEYGNAHRHAADTVQYQEKWKQGEFWNRVALTAMLVSVAVFLVGITLAAIVLPQLSADSDDQPTVDAHSSADEPVKR
jgi:hypothetical protein